MPRRGRRRKKTRTHVNPVEESRLPGARPTPKTIVVKRGRVGNLVESLVSDLRTVLQPNTATKLRERKRGTLKDYVSVAGPLGVTHLLLLSRSEQSVNLRIGRVPRGPTLTFKVEQYSLGNDVRSSQKRPVDFASALRTAPLVVLNNFDQKKNHLKLVSTTFQNIFPTINLQTVKLADCQRIVLLEYNPETDTIEFRHYFIKPVPTGVSRSVKKIVQAKKIPDLSHLRDVSEYVLGSDLYGPGGGAGSDSEYDDDSNKVMLAQDLRTRGAKKGAQSAIRLAEIGPRMTLRLVKVEAGLADGDVLYHAFIKKSAEESRNLKRKHEEADKLRAERREEQERNVQLKKAKLAEKKARKLERRKARKEAAETEEAAEKADASAGDISGSEDDVDSNDSDKGSSDHD